MYKKILVMVLSLALCLGTVVNVNANEKDITINTKRENSETKDLKLSLQFKNEVSEQKIKKENNMKIGAVLKNVNIPGGRAYIYEKVDDKGNLYGGFATGESFYDLGAIGGIQGIEDDFTGVKVLELYGKTVVKFQGTFGSHVSNASYFVIEQGIPVPFLAIQGIVSEMDIDGDGIKEIITELPGTIPSVNISEWDGSSFKTASVDIALGAGSVTFDREDGSFSAYYRKADTVDTEIIGYCYDGEGMRLKQNIKETGDTVSANTIDVNEDSIYEKLVVKMKAGKQYEEMADGPFQGWNWQGSFILQLMDDKGNILSELELNKAFEDEELIFNRTFLVSFDDYNNDGNTDFTIGQYGSSNGGIYRLFTIKNNKIEILPIKTGCIFSSGGGRYSIGLESISDIGFINFYYDNTKGKIIKQYFVWDGSQFVLKTTIEK